MSRSTKWYQTLPTLSMSAWQVVLVPHVILVAAFLCFALSWSTLIAPNILGEHLDVSLLQMLPDILRRFCIVLIAGSLCMIVACLRDRGNKPCDLKDLLVYIYLTLFFCFLVMTRTMQFPIASDDAFIDFDYVYRWVNGLRFDFNSGEHVMGFTSHLHLAVLALCAYLFNRADVSLVSQMVNVVAQICTYVLLFITVRRTTSNELLATLSSILFATSPYYLSESWVGKETSIVSVLIILSIFTLWKRHLKLFAWCAALLFLCRTEGIIWVLAAAVWTFRLEGKSAWRIWLLPGALVAAWYAFLQTYFGSVVPHGAMGKAVMFHTRYSGEDSTIYYALMNLGKQTLGDAFLALFAAVEELVRSPNQTPQWYMAVPLLGIFVMSMMADFSRKEHWLRFYFAAAVLLLGFFALTDPWIYSWYYCWFGLIPILLIPLLVQTLSRLASSPKVLPSLKAITVLAMTYLVLHNFSSLTPLFFWDEPAQRLLQYQQAALYVNHLKRPITTIATWEPGIFGYYCTDKHIIDLGGLLSPEALNYYPVPVNERSNKMVWGSIPPKAIEDLKPDCVLFFDCLADNGLLKNPYFLSHYKLERFWPCSVWGSKGLYLYLSEAGDVQASNGVNK